MTRTSGLALVAAACAPAPVATGELAEDGWRVYCNRELGYRLHYPADASLGTADDPLKTLTITGPLTGDDYWPVIYLSHPGDREDYRPPAIHTRLARSPQTYAYDKYFFARSGQLYVVVLLHAGDKEDWQLYDHFLDSIQFEP